MTGRAGTTRTRRAYAPRMPLEQRKEQLLDAALTLIAREGYAGVTVEAIAAEAGVTKPVVYGAYPKLPLLLGELLDRTYAAALTQLLAAFPDTTPSPGEVTRAWSAAVRGNPRTWGPILLTGAQTPQVVLDRIEDGRRLVRESVLAMLAAGTGRTGSAGAARLDLAAHTIVAAGEHLGRLLLTTPEAVDDDELAALFDDLVRAAVRPQRRSTTSSSTPSASR